MLNVSHQLCSLKAKVRLQSPKKKKKTVAKLNKEMNEQRL